LDIDLIKSAWGLRCPRCHNGSIFNDGFLNLSVKPTCQSCGLDFAGADSGDGPAVFLIFILGFLVVPLALWMEFTLEPPLWVHAIIWGLFLLGVTLGTLRPLKAYVMGLQWKYRAAQWDESVEPPLEPVSKNDAAPQD
jgi:uncharacterized protein (DUF983 family)